MEHGSLLFEAFIYLVAAVISVPIAKRLGLGSVLGYLVAGVIIGPFALQLVGDQTGVMHFAEFGVVLMLFLVGLELKPSLLWRMRGPIIGTGGLQVVLTTGIITTIALLAGIIWQQALAIGMILALSSTAIALQSLQEKGVMNTSAGQSAFSVLLFQDIAVIPILSILPLLVIANPDLYSTTVDGNTHSDWVKALTTLSVIAAIVFGGRFLMNPIFGFIARSKLREIFTASALLLVIGVALAMQAIGLSPALGTFIAGVVLAESNYRHELESNIAPFKGLLLGLFFISVGATIDFSLFAAQPALIIGLTLALVLSKFAVLMVLSKISKLAQADCWLFSFSLAQGGEFAFVLFSFAGANHVLPDHLIGRLTLVVALSMLLTPLLLIIHEKWVKPYYADRNDPQRTPDTIEEDDNPVILISYGRFGQALGRLLVANNVGTTILDHDASQIELVQRFGFKVYYGEGESAELLHSAGADKAKVLVIAVDTMESSLNIARMAKKHFPNLQIVARAIHRQHAIELHRMNVEAIERETFSAGVELGIKTLSLLGWRRNQAYRIGRQFKQHDDQVVQELTHLDINEKEYITQAVAARDMLNKTLDQDRQWQEGKDKDNWKTPG